MNKSFTRKFLPFIAAASWIPSSAFAIGFGEPTVNSPIGEPLDITVPLNLTTDKEELVKFLTAEKSLFEKLNIEQRYIHGQLNYQLEANNGKYALRISSETAVKEPFFELALEARWPNGRVVKDIAVLIDPPTTAASGLLTANSQNTYNSSGNTSLSGNPRSNTAYSNTDSPRPAITGSSYRTQSGDSLSSIAASLPKSLGSFQARMDLIFQSNPKAFINNDRNRLKAAVDIIIPSAGSQAIQALASTENKGDKNTAINTAIKTKVNRTSAAQSSRGSTLQDPLAKSNLQQFENVETATAEATRSLDANRARVAEMQSRLEELQAQYLALNVETNNVKNRVENKISTNNAASAAPTPEFSQQNSSTITVQKQENTSFTSKPLNWILITGGIGVLIVTALILLLRRAVSSQPKNAYGKTFRDYELPESAPIVAAPKTASSLARVADEVEQAPVATRNVSDTATKAAKPASRPRRSTIVAPSEPLPEKRADESDPVLASSVFRAYGRLHDAKNTLEAALTKEPGREDIKLLILEICVELKDHDACQALLKDLKTSKNETILAEVKQFEQRLEHQQAG